VKSEVSRPLELLLIHNVLPFEIFICAIPYLKALARVSQLFHLKEKENPAFAGLQ